METNETIRAGQSRLGLLRVGIILLTLYEAGVHFSRNFPDPVFILNGIGYLAFLAALYLPLPVAKDNRRLVRWLFLGYTLITILAWVALGDKSLPGGALGYITALSEIILIALLWLEGRQAQT